MNRPLLSFARHFSTQRILHHRPNLGIPSQGSRNILVTASLPYVNNQPHLGNIIGAVLSADTFARFCRLRGYNTLYICGTDQYGTTSLIKAHKQGISEQELCDKFHKRHKQIYQWFNISFDFFGRTTHPAHGLQTHENDLIENRTIKQFYCDNCKISLADRYVTGVCGNCGSNKAQGDQCDNCSTLFKDPIKQITDPKCANCLNSAAIKQIQHLYFKVTSLSPQLLQWLNNEQTTQHWSNSAKGITKAYLKGLHDRCITRDLTWGIPVPQHILKDKVFYVWFQAPIGYTSMTRQLLSEDWIKWWKPEHDVELNQFMGKDNAVFHTIMHPAVLMGTKQNWVLPKRISVTQHLMYEGGKFSKSRGIGVFGDNCRQTGIQSDVWRYYLLSIRPETFDTEFSWQNFIERNNKDLVNSIGNLFHRIVKYTYAKYNQKLSIEPSMVTQLENNLVTELSELVKQYCQMMENVEIKGACLKVLQFSHILNKYAQQSQFWSRQNRNSGRTAVILKVSLNCLNIYSQMMCPFLPVTSQRMKEMLGVSTDDGLQWQGVGERILSNQHNYKIEKEPEILFKEITEEKKGEFGERYGSNK